MRYNNYHKHDHSGNPWITDTIAKEEDYCKRAKELGHTTCFTVNHGVQGRIFDWMECAKKYDLKMIYGTEAYYVDDRQKEYPVIDPKTNDYKRDKKGNIITQKDKSNRHLIIVARNNDGVKQLNKIMSEAHSTGFYYRPRIDRSLLFSLNPSNFIITTACVAGIWNDSELILALHNHFKDNLFLEVQNHNIDIQKEANKQLLTLNKETGIKIIHANDSHYIYPQDEQYRTLYLKGKGFNYSDEDGMILDYPDSDAIFQRYEQQGILSHAQVQEALNNTLVFDECEEITLINDDIKLPAISDHPTEELRTIINNSWKRERINIPKEKHQEYLDAIREEVNIVEKTHMEQYFLIDYHVVKDGQEKYDGKLTNTGRGSAPSFYITKLLGLTDIDRIAAPITLFPSRFMSIERILGAKSLPDIDLNTTDRVPFIKATEDLLGAENCAWMVSWKPLQKSNAFRLFCKSKGYALKDYDHIAKDLEKYENDPKWGAIIEESKVFIGVIESVSESPCSELLYYKPVNEELGLVRTTGGAICCLLDGYNCDKYKYLKNDYLTVTVWAIIRDTCRLANIPIPTIEEINNLFDDKTFEVYKNGLTCTINQADSDFATGLVRQYQPQSVSEMSAFVAIIRPGCASLRDDFIQRKPYTTGIKELDELLIEGNHRMIYQELIMKYLIWLGIPETGSYDIIKKISKKKFKEAELSKLKAELLQGWIKQVGTEDGFDETWSVVQDAAKYSFNASHSLSYAYDSLYGAYLKSHYPLEYYTVAFNYYDSDSDRTSKLTKELGYYGIKLKSSKFRYSKADYMLNREENSIYKGVQSIKGLNAEVGNQLYELRNNKYDSFIDLLYDIKQQTTLQRDQVEILIKLNYFEEFGEINYLLRLQKLFLSIAGKKQLSKEKVAKLQLNEKDVYVCSTKVADKTYRGINADKLLKLTAKNIKVKRFTVGETIKAQAEYLGYIEVVDQRYSRMLAIMDIDLTYSPKLTCYSLKNGTTIECKINKRIFRKNPLNKYDVIRVIDHRTKPKSVWNEEIEDYETVPNTSEMWLTKYKKVEL